MAVIMVIIAIGWVHRPDSRQIEPAGWLEQARRANFAEHTGDQLDASDPGTDFDDDEHRLQQYNEWLRRLDSQPGQH